MIRIAADILEHFALELGFDAFVFGGSDPQGIETFIGGLRRRS